MNTATIKNIRKGFTVIELLVVVAIISVLAVIILVNVTGNINKGKNSAIKSNIGTIVTNSAIWFEKPSLGNGSYAGFTADALYTGPAAAVQKANGNVAPLFGNTTANTAFCICSPIFTIGAESGAFCADSTGFKGVKTACDSAHCSTGATATDGICKGS